MNNKEQLTKKHMKEFKGTKGEWEVNHLDDIFIENKESKGVCRILENGFYDYEEWVHNAKLIAAAPELLNALKELVKLKDIKDNKGKTDYYINNKDKAWKEAKKAINKALN